MPQEKNPDLPPAIVDVLKCPICFFPSTSPGRLRRSGYNFDYCPACSVLFMNPTPTQEDLISFYGGAYWERTNSKRSRRYRFKKQFLRALFFEDELKKAGVPKGGRILEIGSGFGGIVWALSHLRDMEPSALELDPQAGLFQQKLGVKILDSGVQEGSAAQGGFDVVVLSHVLEHQLDPRELLRKAFGLLNPSGTVLIEVPHHHFVVDGSIDHPLAFSKYALDRLLREFAGDVRYRVHSGIENVALPPKYLLGVARVAQTPRLNSVRHPLPAAISLPTQRIATFARNFGPLRGANYRLSRMFRGQIDRRVQKLFESLPPWVSGWLDEPG